MMHSFLKSFGLATTFLIGSAACADAQLWFAGPPDQQGRPQTYAPGTVAIQTQPGTYYAPAPAGGPTYTGGQPLGTYQPGQVAISAQSGGGPTSGGTTTIKSSYNGMAQSNGQGAEGFATAFAPSPLGDAAGAAAGAMFGLTGGQTAYRQPYRAPQNPQPQFRPQLYSNFRRGR
jgi:hypothetical protein